MLEASSSGDYLSSMLEQDARFNTTLYQATLMALRAERAWLTPATARTEERD